MFQSISESNRFLHDPVPKNVSKFPIHQTFLTSDAERNAKGEYKFKVPEIWSSARSGKKSIAVRSIQWHPKQIHLSFRLSIHKKTDGNNYANDIRLLYDTIIAPFQKTYEVLLGISEYINGILKNDDNKDKGLTFDIDYENNTMTFQVIHETDDYVINLEKLDIEHEDNDNTKPIIRSPFDELFNQPYSDNDGEFHDIITFHNVWDRFLIDFHSSLIPFDNYQYLGGINDKWNNPIVYQDPNTSPLFNVWTTTDLKTPFPILYENFVIRMTFIISSENQYHA